MPRTRGFDPALLAFLAAAFIALAGPAQAAEDAPATGERFVVSGQPLSYWIQQATGGSREAKREDVVAALSAVVQQGDPVARWKAADGLAALGADARAAANALAGTLDLPQPWVRSAAMAALASIGPDAVPSLVDVVRSGPASAGGRALSVLQAMGPQASAALPALEAALRTPDHPVKAKLPAAIAAIRGEAGPASTRPTQEVSLADAPALSGGDTAGDWPQFHGPRRDAICSETGLWTEWSQREPQLLWKLEGLGRGYSSVAIVGDRLFTMGDRSTQGGSEAQCVMAYELGTRRLVWSTSIGPPHEDGGPRCTPTVDGGRLFALGTAGDLVCLNAADGRVIWKRNLPADFGGVMMSVWKFSESPLVDGRRVICTPGGPEAALAALDWDTGATLWTSRIPALGEKGKDGAAYASAVVAEIGGVRQYVQLLGRGVVGVDAESGRFLWGYNRVANDTANIPTPVVRGDYVFATTAYGAGAALLRIQRDGASWRAEEVYYVSPADFQNHHGGVVALGDYLYGGKGNDKGFPVCLNLATGEVVWQDRGPGQGSAAIVYADGHLIFRYDRGQVAAIEATPEAYRLKGTFTPVLGEGPAWAHPVVHQGKLYLRHADVLACYDLRKAS